MVDQAARSGAAGRAAHAHPPDQVDHAGHGQEVGRQAEPADQREFVVQAGACLGGGGDRAQAQARLAAGAQFGGGSARRDTEHLRLGVEHAADAEVLGRVRDQTVGEGAGGVEQRGGTAAGRAGDLGGDGDHVEGGLEVFLGAGTGEVVPAERDQSAGRVEHVGDRGVLAVGVAHRVGEHGGHPVGIGQERHPGRVGGRAGPAERRLMAYRFDEEGVPGRRGSGANEQPLGVRGLVGGDRPPDLRVGSGRHHGAVGRGERVPRGHRVGPVAPVRVADQPAQRTPTGLAPGEHGDPGMAGVGERAATRRGPSPPARLGGGRFGGQHRELGAQDRPDARPDTSARERDGAVDPVPIGQRERVRTVFDRALDQRARVRDAVAHRMPGRDVQVGERAVRSTRSVHGGAFNR
nr:hypothetical protein [Embleya scabrispora]